jgi:amidase
MKCAVANATAIVASAVRSVAGEETLESPFHATIDELYWCFRRLQAREAWQCHGEWLKAKPRRLGPDAKDRFDFGATVDDKIAHAEAVRRIAFRAELVFQLADIFGEQRLGAADLAGSG